ncbi:hypothetical protein GCM10010174_31970 [Kutzneria viridogrisea]|uniref:Uncharacterized protein n=2 Tax=Kutzneria TaxID=43356 RepID=W5VX89_9PSEU|nr:hypothetical protein [Kutzneria albida]AHH93458.1 hypothetical protein KALB_81 [Kutzneria albida DSM 43870]MBA8929156.1 hypothetical protein [Kutzneria viridogrisea]
MPLSTAVRRSCLEFLQPDEQIDYVFPAISAGPPGMISVLVVVSRSRITVLACKQLRRNEPDSVWASFPRTSRLTPVEEGAGPVISLGSMLLEIDDEYLSVVRAADAEMSGDEFLPPDPLPDL